MGQVSHKSLIFQSFSNNMCEFSPLKVYDSSLEGYYIYRLYFSNKLYFILIFQKQNNFIMSVQVYVIFGSVRNKLN